MHTHTHNCLGPLNLTSNVTLLWKALLGFFAQWQVFCHRVRSLAGASVTAFLLSPWKHYDTSREQIYWAGSKLREGYRNDIKQRALIGEWSVSVWIKQILMIDGMYTVRASPRGASSSEREHLQGCYIKENRIPIQRQPHSMVQDHFMWRQSWVNNRVQKVLCAIIYTDPAY